MSEEDYLLTYELEPENHPKCICCGELPQLGSRWKWKKNCKKKECVRAAINLGFTDEVKKRIGASVKKTFKENPDIVKKMTESSKASNKKTGKDGFSQAIKVFHRLQQDIIHTES